MFVVHVADAMIYVNGDDHDIVHSRITMVMARISTTIKTFIVVVIVGVGTMIRSKIGVVLLRG